MFPSQKWRAVAWNCQMMPSRDGLTSADSPPHRGDAMMPRTTPTPRARRLVEIQQRIVACEVNRKLAVANYNPREVARPEREVDVHRAVIARLEARC